MNASNLPQLRPQSRCNPDRSSEGSNSIFVHEYDHGYDFQGDRSRHGSGSFKGPEESDEEIVFRGVQSDDDE